MMVSAMSLMAVARIGPDSRNSVAQGRSSLCESIAFSTSSLLNERDFDRMEAVLGALVERNEDVLSAGLRRKTGLSLIHI